MCKCKDNNPCKCLDGKNAYTTTTANFIQPACEANVTISVKDTEWAIVGQPIFIEGGGQYEVVSKTINTITIKNLCGLNNAAVGSTVLSKKGVSPSGFNGLDGENGVCEDCACDINATFSWEKPDTELGIQSVLTVTPTSGTAPYTYEFSNTTIGSDNPISISTVPSIDISVLDPNQVIITETYSLVNEDPGGFYYGLIKVTVTDSTGCKKDFYQLYNYFVPYNELD